MLDQATTADEGAPRLGWQPTGPGLVEEFRSGRYGS
jgi:hypothetical protein